MSEQDFSDLYDFGKQIVNIPNLKYVDKIKKTVITVIREYLNKEDLNDDDLLNNCHKYMKCEDLNELRLKIMNRLNSDTNSKENYYNAFKPIIYNIIGRNTAVQKRINLVVQFPGNNEITPMHSDVEDGDSPFELTFWLPLTRVYGSKSMYCLDKNFGGSIINLCAEKEKDLKKVTEEVVKPEHFVKMNYGEALLFNPLLLHGNIINETSETRWALNWRVKSIFSPYSFKNFGEYFEIYEMSPHTRLAMEYYKEKFNGSNGPNFN